MKNKLVSLTVPAETGLTQIVTSFVEKSACAFGLMERESLALTLASEEVFTFLSETSSTKDDIQVICRGRGYCVEMCFDLKSGMLPLEAFNLTRRVAPEDADAGGQLGLILAARVVDHLTVDRIGKDRFALRFVENKRYPALESRAPLPELSGKFSVQVPDVSMIKEFSTRLAAAYGDSAEPSLCVPGKLIDMVGSGDYELLVASNGKGQVAGGIVFSRTKHIAEAFGPFVFLDKLQLPELLVEGMLERLGRAKNILCVVIMDPTPQMPCAHFEKLNGGALYRQLEEDDGARVFVHPCFKDFLSGFYRELALPRILQEVKYMGEELALNSAIATSIDRQKKRAELSLLWPGRNFAENLSSHVRLLRSQGLDDLRFCIELDSSDGAMMSPLLMDAGFTPWMILPWAGRGDIAVFSLLGKATGV